MIYHCKNKNDLTTAVHAITDCELWVTSEELALRYASGYVPFKLIKRYKKMKKNKIAMDFISVLSSWAKHPETENCEDFVAYTEEWVNLQNRGGLFKINDQIFAFFTLLEQAVRSAVNTKNVQQLRDVNLQQLLINRLENDEIISSKWHKIVPHLPRVCSSKLRQEVFSGFVKMRCDSFIKAYINIRKRLEETTTTKQKGLRKTLTK